MTTDSPTVRRKEPATVAEVNAMRTPGRHSVGDGLLLVVNPSGSRSWLARVRDPSGRRRDIGLGSYPEVSLKEAREKVAGFRRQARDGLDPVAVKRKARDVVPSFKVAAERAHGERESGYRNEKHGAQWLQSLRDYAFPAFGHLPVDQITGPMIVQCIKKIWLSKPETARRVLQRIGTVIAWSAAHGYREHEAPMRAIRMGLSPQPKNKKHHAAIPYADAPAAVAALLSKTETVSRNCLAFIVWTAARSGEARGARWSEVDFKAETWTVPADRIKMAVEHVVPLSTPAMTLLKRLHAVRTGDLIFPGLKNRRKQNDSEPMLSDVAVSKALAEVAPNVTVHGWRSTFKDWASEETNTPSEVSEKALAHQIPNAVERAYRRGDLLEKRRQLMEAWAGFLEGRSAKVVELRGAAA